MAWLFVDFGPAGTNLVLQFAKTEEAQVFLKFLGSKRLGPGEIDSETWDAARALWQVHMYLTIAGLDVAQSRDRNDALNDVCSTMDLCRPLPFPAPRKASPTCLSK
ncbi:hypothetical protein ACJZ2D_003826 [Fusarium nematophilum]